MTHGTVKWFNESKKLGFFEQENGDDFIVHYSALAGNSFKSLTEGDKVTFVTTKGPKALQAANANKI